MRISWTLLNAALLAVVVLEAQMLAAACRQPLRHLPEPPAAKDTGKTKVPAPMMAPGGHLSLERFDQLWRKSLFSPRRTEIAEAEPAEKPQAIAFDLIGVGSLNGRMVAIVGTGNNPAGKTIMPGPKKSRHVCKVGEPVGDSGWLVGEVGASQVVLVKGDEQKILTFDPTASARRRNQASNPPPAGTGTTAVPPVAAPPAKAPEPGLPAAGLAAGGQPGTASPSLPPSDPRRQELLLRGGTKP